MSRTVRQPDHTRSRRGRPSGRREDAPTPKVVKPKKPSAKVAQPKVVKPKKPLRVSVYGGSQGRGGAEQQVRTVREVILARLDDLGATRLLPAALRFGLTKEQFLDMYQEWLLALFPDECGDGEPYVPDPAERMDLPPGVKMRFGGLFPYPCEGVGDVRSVTFARHLLRGQKSPVAGMRTKDGARLFSDAELARLGERQERRSTQKRPTADRADGRSSGSAKRRPLYS